MEGRALLLVYTSHGDSVPGVSSSLAFHGGGGERGGVLFYGVVGSVKAGFKTGRLNGDRCILFYYVSMDLRGETCSDGHGVEGTARGLDDIEGG